MEKPVKGFDRLSGVSFGASTLGCALALFLRIAPAFADSAPTLLYFTGPSCHRCPPASRQVELAAERLPPGHVMFVRDYYGTMIMTDHPPTVAESARITAAVRAGTALPRGFEYCEVPRPPQFPYLIVRHEGVVEMAGDVEPVKRLLRKTVPPGRSFRAHLAGTPVVPPRAAVARRSGGSRASRTPTGPTPPTLSELNQCGIYQDDELPTRLASDEAAWRALLPATDQRPHECTAQGEAFERGFREGLSGQRFVMSFTIPLWEERSDVSLERTVGTQTCGSIIASLERPAGSSTVSAPVVGGVPEIPGSPPTTSAPATPVTAPSTPRRGAFSPQRPDRQACQAYRGSPTQATALDCCIKGFVRALPHLASYLTDDPDRDNCNLPPAGREHDPAWTQPDPDSPLCTTNSCRSAFTFGETRARQVCEAASGRTCAFPLTYGGGEIRIRHLGCFHLGVLLAHSQCSGRSDFTAWLAANSSSVSDRVLT